jgi:hypothetical protein
MNNAVQAFAVMFALLLRPADNTSFEIASAKAAAEPKKIYAVLLHDEFWRVTSVHNPRGTDYKIEGDTFIMCNSTGRMFHSKINQDQNFDGVDLSAAKFEVPFNHPSFGSPAIIERNPFGIKASDKGSLIVLLRQEKEGRTRPLLITFHKPEI